MNMHSPPLTFEPPAFAFVLENVLLNMQGASPDLPTVDEAEFDADLVALALRILPAVRRPPSDYRFETLFFIALDLILRAGRDESPMERMRNDFVTCQLRKAMREARILAGYVERAPDTTPEALRDEMQARAAAELKIEAYRIRTRPMGRTEGAAAYPDLDNAMPGYREGPELVLPGDIKHPRTPAEFEAVMKRDGVERQLGRGLVWRGTFQEFAALGKSEPPLFLKYTFIIRYRNRDCVMVLDRLLHEELKDFRRGYTGHLRWFGRRELDSLVHGDDWAGIIKDTLSEFRCIARGG